MNDQRPRRVKTSAVSVYMNPTLKKNFRVKCARMETGMAPKIAELVEAWVSHPEVEKLLRELESR